MNILVLGAGAWGTALAVSASDNPRQAHHVTLWARDAAQARAMRSDRANARYLPGLPLPAGLQIADGADVAEGSTTDVAVLDADGTGVSMIAAVMSVSGLALPLRSARTLAK